MSELQTEQPPLDTQVNGLRNTQTFHGILLTMCDLPYLPNGNTSFGPYDGRRSRDDQDKRFVRKPSRVRYNQY